MLSVGLILDYIDEYVEQNKKENKKQDNVRKANQDDFSNF